MIGREEVLHIARLSRLKIDEEDVGRMAVEISSILGHIEKIGELDLEGVDPTTHVVAVENVLRDDTPEESLPRDRAIAGAGDVFRECFRVQSPGR